MVEIFSASQVVHIGGDEVIIGSDESWAACYNSSTLGAPILELLQEKGLSRDDPNSFYLLWENFTTTAGKMVTDSFAEVQVPLSKLHIWGGGGVSLFASTVDVNVNVAAAVADVIVLFDVIGNDDSGVCYNLMTRPDVTSFLPPSLYTVQVWDETETSISHYLIRRGYDIILSNTDYVYLDCGNAGPNNPGGNNI